MHKLFFDHALLPTGWASDVVIDVDNGIITAIAAGVDRQERFAAQHINSGGIALPGLASLHSHSFQRALAGLGETRGPVQDSFWSWRQVMYNFLAVLEPDDIEAIAAFAFMDMLEGGFTCVGEFHYLHHDSHGQSYDNPAEHCERIASAAASTGIGLTLLPSFYEQGGFNNAPSTQGQRRFINSPEQFLRLVEVARHAISGLAGSNLGIAPHSLRAVSPKGLAAVLAATPAGPVHIHVAEQLREVEECLAWSGQRPVEWLLAHAPVDKRWCLIHATHMTDAETTDVATRGAVAGLCPITEANLGDGTFNAPVFNVAQGMFGVGSDSNVEISAAGELKQLEYSQRLALRARNIMAQTEGSSTGGTLYRAAVAGGARALARNDGALATGRRADMVVLDGNHPDLAHATGDRWLDTYIFAAGKAAIQSVHVGGVQVVENGQHHARTSIIKRYRATMKKITSAL